MPSDFSFINSGEWLKLAQWSRRVAPRKFGVVNGMLLNEFAEGTQHQAAIVVHDRMTIRNQRFVTSRFGHGKARFADPISRQVSFAGVRKTARFSGWVEQELGEKGDRQHFPTTQGRGGNVKKRIRRGWRLDRPFPRPSDFKTGSNSNDWTVFVMIRILMRKKYKRPFIIDGHSKLPDGLYRLVRGRLKLLQSFSDPKRRRD